MSTTTQTRPPAMQAIAAILLANGVLGLWALSQATAGQKALVAIPSLAGKEGTVFAYAFAGLAFVCFLIAGIALLSRRRRAIPFYLGGTIFAAGYVAVAFLIFFIQAAWQSIATGALALGDAIYLTAVIGGGCLISFVVARAIYNYLQDLSRSGVLR